jgi:anti-sigma regulatory factor (Ser/Thr protein kinase)
MPRGRKLTFSSFDRHLVDGSRTCDLSELVFIDAYGLVGSACALLGSGRPPLEHHLVEPVQPQRRDHLSAMGLTDFLAHVSGKIGRPVSAAEAFPEVVVPLTLIEDTAVAEQASHLLWAQVRHHVDPTVLQALSEGLWELVANALEHSEAQAILMGQVYRGGEPPDHDDRVQVVIGDAGRGIRESFARGTAYGPKDDRKAIEHALEYLVSSVEDPGRGQGLTTTLEEVTALGGKLAVRSGTAKVTVHANHRTAESVPPMHGTIVAMSLPLYPGLP